MEPVITYTPTQFEMYKGDIINELEKILGRIDDDTIVKCLIIGVIDGGGVLTGGDGFFISKETSVNFLYRVLLQHAIDSTRKYHGVSFTS
jgi:hypothetical protein